LTGRRSLTVNFVDFYERMLAAGAEPRDMSPLMEKLEATMWADVQSWFRSLQTPGAAEGSQSAGRRSASGQGSGRGSTSGQGQHGLHGNRGPSERGQQRGSSHHVVGGAYSGDGGSASASSSRMHLPRPPAPVRMASPESALVHGMLWQGINGR
jgi:hypothetical protein